MTTPMTDDEFKRKYRPNWKKGCENCGQKPTLNASGLCGPCHWGTAEALNGGWWNAKTDDLDETFAENHLPEAK